MLNIEEILIKVIQLLEIDLKGTKLEQRPPKVRFINNEVSEKIYREYFKLIFTKLNLNTYNVELVNIFIDLINLYLPIYNKLNRIKFISTQKKFNWIILKRLVIPYLAKRLSSLDYDYNTRIDKGLSGGKFWYLPDITDYQNVKLPIEYLMNWWLDLFGKGFDSLCNQLDSNNKSENKSFESKNTIKQWFKKSIPTRNKIEEYCSIPLTYKGTFEIDEKDPIDTQFKKACIFVTNKPWYTIDALKLEIPYNSLVDKIFLEKKDISTNDKKSFIKYVSERWAKPSSKKLIDGFLIGKFSQSIYERLLKYFSLEDTHDFEKNKILQLIYLYTFLYNENLQRKINNVPRYDTVDFTNIYFEYLDAFGTDKYKLINTLANDINIEVSNPKYTKYTLEDIYQIKVLVYAKHKDNRLKESTDELKEHIKFFQLKFDKIEIDVEKYFSLSYKEKISFIEKIDDFECLINIYDREFLHNYNLTEKCLFQMKKISNIDHYKQLTALQFLKLYSSLILEDNIQKFIETKNLLENYEKQSNLIELDNENLLKIKIHFYIKSKQFDLSLKSSIEYYTKYIKNQKKDDFLVEILFLGAYSAYTEKDKDNLKIFNRELKKYVKTTFENRNSLPFPIYFYKF